MATAAWAVLAVIAVLWSGQQLGANGQERAYESGRPRPAGSNADWDFVKSASLQTRRGAVWKRIKAPSDFLQLAFQNVAFSVEQNNQQTFSIELPSGEELFVSAEDTEENSTYHVFEIKSHTFGIFSGPSIAGSEFFVWLSSAPGSDPFAMIEIGWLGVVDPQNSEREVEVVMTGLMLTLLDNLRLEFGAGDCAVEPFKRSATGVCNNPDYPGRGASFTSLRRLEKNDPAYKDGKNQPSGSNINPRAISNALCKNCTDNREDDTSNRDYLTDLFVFFGQFVDHDLDLSPTGELSSATQPLFSHGRQKFHEDMGIDIPKDDKFMSTEEEIVFERAVWVQKNNKEVLPREHLNVLSAFLDLGQVYASEHIRAGALRTMKGGKLKTSKGDLMPLNGNSGKDSIGIAVENAPDASSEYFVGGDVRANENILLTAQHVLWLREHNRVADELNEVFPEYGDEDLFTNARAIVIAEYQSIVYNEWLKLLLGPGELDPSEVEYNPDLDPSISTFFSTAAFRFGHSMVNKFLWVVNEAEFFGVPKPAEIVPLRDAFFNPQRFRKAGVDGLLLGAAWHLAPELDIKLVDDIRNFLFSEEPDKDLLAINIQRGRDMGLPSYNDAREAFGLTRARVFEDITNDRNLAIILAEAYDFEIDDVDAIVGGLAERPFNKSILGELFFTAIKDQFKRLRDGDRLFYKIFPFAPTLVTQYPRLRSIINDEVTLADIIIRNTEISRENLGLDEREGVFYRNDSVVGRGGDERSLLK